MAGVNAAGYRKTLPVPERCAGLGLRMRKCALIEKLDEILCEQNIQCPIVRDKDVVRLSP
jgi:hypothetical protein